MPSLTANNLGLTETQLYRCWANIITRCTNPASKSYQQYGGRGITVCDEWANSFRQFAIWALSHGYEKTLQLDRVDSNGNYEPSNCRFVTVQVQIENRPNLQKNNKSGFRGVHYCKSAKKWRAKINHRKEIVLDELFPTVLEAVKARDQFITDNNLPHQLNGLAN